MHGGQPRLGAWGGREEGAVHLGVQGGQQVRRAPETVGGCVRGCQVEAAHNGVAGDQWQNTKSQLKVKAV